MISPVHLVRIAVRKPWRKLLAAASRKSPRPATGTTEMHDRTIIRVS